MLIKIAWRNIWRNRNRSLVIFFAVIVGIWSSCFLMAFYNGMITDRIRNAINTELSHLQLHEPSFQGDYELKYNLPDGTRLLDSIKKLQVVQAAGGRIIIKGMISSAAGSQGVQINGVMPESESALTGLSGKLKQGRYFGPAGKNELLIGRKLLQKLKIKENSKVVLTFSDKDGNIASAAFRVIGVYEVINTPYEETNVFVNLKDVEILAGIPGSLNEIAVLLSDQDQVNEFSKRLAGQRPNVRVQTWREISPEMELLVSSFTQMMFIYMGIVLLALAFGIVNTMLMSVLERTREIGMLLSLGMNRPRIFSMILFETVFLALAGLPFGVGATLITVMLTRINGISLERFSETYNRFGYSHVIYPELDLKQLGLMLMLVIGTALIASLFPARRALLLKPAEAIRK